MEESQEILLKSLESYGVSIPDSVSSIAELTSDGLVSICAQCLNRIDDTSSFPTYLPSDSIADRVRICTDIASAVKNLGYTGDISFHKFLYPSEGHLYKLIRFLAERISELSEGGRIAGHKSTNSISKQIQDNLRSPLKDSTEKVDEEVIRYETDKVQNQRKVIVDEVTSRTSEVEHLEQELELMKAAAEMALDDKHSVDFYLNQLSEQVQAKSYHLLKLKLEWDAVRKPLEERKRSLEESLFSNYPDAREILQKLREVEKEEQFILCEIRKRDEEHSKLCLDLEKQPKLASRKSFVQRINEITKNSRKQDADIERILKETRNVQLESNSIQERLHRTYAVADEMVFREAKKDPTGRQVYRLLTGIHEGFEQLSEKILATDRLQREVVEYEMKLAAIGSRSFDVDKLKADLDAITRENEYLEQKLLEK